MSCAPAWGCTPRAGPCEPLLAAAQRGALGAQKQAGGGASSLGGARVGVASRWEGGAGVLEPSAAKGPVQGVRSQPPPIFPSEATTQEPQGSSTPTVHPSPNAVVTYTPCTGTHRLPLMSPELTPSPVSHPRRKGCAHRDPSRPLHVDTSSSHCGSKLSAGCLSHQPHPT